MVGFYDAKIVEEKFVAARCAKLPPLKKHAHFRSRAVQIVRECLHDYWHFVRSVAFEDKVLEHELFVTDSSTLLNSSLDGIPCHRGSAGLLHSGVEAGIAFDVRSAEFRRDHHFLYQFANNLAFLQICDFSLSMEPLSSHRHEANSDPTTAATPISNEHRALPLSASVRSWPHGS